MFLFDQAGIDPGRRSFLSAFQKSAGIRFKSLKLLDLAFIHRSVTNEGAFPQNNERLEFLGDSVLGMVVATRLFQALGDRQEGDLARIKSIVVSEETLSQIALSLGIDACLALGKGEELSGGRRKKAILADALEALIGAYFVDSGFEQASRFVQRLLVPEIEKVLENKHRKDYKTIVQEYAQKHLKGYPIYSVVKRSGPDHDRVFSIECRFGEATFGPAEGHSKKDAEREAARLVYEFLASREPEAGRLRELEGR